MYRLKSLEPFSRHFSGHKFLDMLELKKENGASSVTGIIKLFMSLNINIKKSLIVYILLWKVGAQYVDKVSTILSKYKESLKKNRLLQISFTTLSEYLWLLRGACQALSVLEKKAIIYLAAATSDFYIPSNEMVTYLTTFQINENHDYKIDFLGCT